MTLWRYYHVLMMCLGKGLREVFIRRGSGLIKIVCGSRVIVSLSEY